MENWREAKDKEGKELMDWVRAEDAKVEEKHNKIKKEQNIRGLYDGDVADCRVVTAEFNRRNRAIHDKYAKYEEEEKRLEEEKPT